MLKVRCLLTLLELAPRVIAVQHMKEESAVTGNERNIKRMRISEVARVWIKPTTLGSVAIIHNHVAGPGSQHSAAAARLRRSTL